VATWDDPSSPDAWEELGDAHRRALQGARARDAYRTALQLDPSRGHLLERTGGKPSREAEAMRRQAMRSPTDDELWGDLGDLLRMEGNLAEARQAYLRAFRIDPEDSEWQRALVELGDAELVVTMLQGRLVETDDESLGDLADMLVIAGRTDEACELYRRAAEIDPYDDEWIGHATECGYPIPEDYDPNAGDTGYGGVEGGVLGGFGSLYSDGGYGGVPEASELDSLVERVSSNADLLLKLGQAYLMSGDREKAEENLWAALLVDHTDEEALQSYLLVTGKTRREVLERLRDTFSDDDELVGLLADHYLDLGLRDRARDLYDLAHSLDEDDPEWTAKQKLLEAARP
jgi:tetratricopeptide (TPR) repeat protein